MNAEHSDPKVLQDAAAGKIPHDAAERKKEVEEVRTYLFPISSVLHR